LTIHGNHFWQNGNGDTSHQSYLEGNNITYEFNFYDQPGSGTACSQLKDRSSGTIVRYNYFYPSARELDLIDSQAGAPVIVPQTVLTVPSGGFASGATSLKFSGSVSGVNVGDVVGYYSASGGWGYPGSGAPVMPTVSAVNTSTNTLTLQSPGLPAALTAGTTLNVISRQLNPYMQTFVYGNIFDMDESLYWGGVLNPIHYGWDTQVGMDSVYDRAGTLYFYDNTMIVRWDQSSTYWFNLFQTESSADNIEAANNLWYVVSSTSGAAPTYFYLVGASQYGASGTDGVYAGGNNQIVSSSSAGQTTCNSITETGWGFCNNSYTTTNFSASDSGSVSTETAAQMYPNGLVGTRNYALQAGSSAIGAASSLPAAITSNTLGLNLTPVYQYGGAARTSLADLGAFQYSGDLAAPPPPTDLRLVTQ
jgi:hypothetical protein